MVGTEIVGVDLKAGYVTLLDDELVAELDRASRIRSTENSAESADEAKSGTTYYRRDGSFSLTVADLELTGMPMVEEDLWLSVERPSGRLPWEAKNPKQLVGVRGSNIDGVVEHIGLEPMTSSMPLKRSSQLS